MRVTSDEKREESGVRGLLERSSSKVPLETLLQ